MSAFGLQSGLRASGCGEIGFAGVAVHAGCLPAVRLNSHLPCGDEAARRWGCCRRTLVRAFFRGEARIGLQTTSGLRPGPKGEQVLGRDLQGRLRRRHDWKDSGSLPPDGHTLWVSTAARSHGGRHDRVLPSAITEAPDESLETSRSDKASRSKARAEVDGEGNSVESEFPKETKWGK
ncbi:MAG: hypothetical protein RLZZ536_2518 [Planctomycetota bacterium]